MISGKPVRSEIERTGRPASASARAVPPVEIELDAELGEPARELDDPGLVGDRQQRPGHLHLVLGDWSHS